MGTPLGPKYIPYTYMDPLGGLYRGYVGVIEVLRLHRGIIIKVILFGIFWFRVYSSRVVENT